MANRPLRKEIKYTLLYWFVRSLIFLSGIMPRKVWLAFCGFLGWLGRIFSPKPYEKVVRHLTMAFGKEKSPEEIQKIAREVFVMLGKNAGDVLRASSVKTLDDFLKFTVVEGFENVEKANERKAGIIFLASHLGGFDLMVTYVALRGYYPMIIGTALKDEKLNQMMVNYRNAHGTISVARGKETMRLFKGLKQGGSTAILIDQDTKVKSRFVNFFGMPASSPIGATVLAMKTKAAVVPCYIHLDENGMQHINFLPEVPLIDTGDEEADLVANTQVYNSIIEDAIRKHPSQWVWMHERWKTKPGEEIV